MIQPTQVSSSIPVVADADVVQSAAAAILSDGDSIYSLLYKDWETRDLLKNQEEYNNAFSVEVVGPHQPDISVTIQGTGQVYSFHTSDYLTPFLTLRLNRTSRYKAVQDKLNPNLFVVYETTGKRDYQNPTGIPKPPREVSYQDGKLRCSCEDFTKQSLLLPTHPWLWNAILGQPACKHLIRACLDYPELLYPFIAHLPSQTFHKLAQTKRNSPAEQVPLEDGSTMQTSLDILISTTSRANLPQLKRIPNAQLAQLYQTTTVPQGWALAISQEDYEIIRSTILCKVTNTDAATRLAYLEQLALDLGLPGYFPSPAPVIDALLEHAELEDGQDICEPGAGNGYLAQAIANRAKVNLHLMEIQPILREVLHLKGFSVLAPNFLEYQGSQKFDRIIGNPDFMQDTRYLYHSMTLLKPQGIAALVVGNTCLDSSESRFKAFRQWLKDMDAQVHPLPPGSFLNSDRPTPVQTSIVKVRCPQA